MMNRIGRRWSVGLGACLTLLLAFTAQNGWAQPAPASVPCNCLNLNRNNRRLGITMNEDSLHKPLCRTRAPRMPNIDGRFTRPIRAVNPSAPRMPNDFSFSLQYIVTNHPCHGLQGERRTWRIRRKS